MTSSKETKKKVLTTLSVSKTNSFFFVCLQFEYDSSCRDAQAAVINHSSHEYEVRSGKTGYSGYNKFATSHYNIAGFKNTF